MQAMEPISETDVTGFLEPVVLALEAETGTVQMYPYTAGGTEKRVTICSI